MLKNCAIELCLPAARLFSLCFRQQVQPRLWKVARVVPVHKKKARSDLCNYRPVSLLCILSKTMETIVDRCIMNFFSKHSVISSRQYGFRKGLGTSDLLTKLYNDWLSTVANGGMVHVLAIDIAGAFDKVSHRGVLYKAEARGISGPLLGWLSNYLCCRQLRAIVVGQQSSEYPVLAGAPKAVSWVQPCFWFT